jgi:hypothetical protein
MEVYPFHHRDLFFNIITDYDLTFKEVREILDSLLKIKAFSGEGEDSEPGKILDLRLGNVCYEVDLHGYEVLIYRRSEIEG